MAIRRESKPEGADFSRFCARHGITKIVKQATRETVGFIFFMFYPVDEAILIFMLIFFFDK
jgi:hypothetical protein